MTASGTLARHATLYLPPLILTDPGRFYVSLKRWAPASAGRQSPASNPPKGKPSEVWYYFLSGMFTGAGVSDAPGGVSPGCPF